MPESTVLRICALTLFAAALAPASASQAPTSQAPEVRAEGATATAAGDSYHAVFTPSGLSFHALPGPVTGSPKVQFGLLAVERGGQRAETDLRPVAPRIEGHTVFYDRPGLRERYEVREEGVAQSFVIDQPPPGTGDLVVRGRLLTDLVGDHRDTPVEQLTFSSAGGVGIHFGAVTGIDASGGRTAGTMRWTDDELELILPADFVDRATWPVIVDPLIGSRLTPSATNAELPDVAFDRTTQTFVIVWRQNTAAAGQWRPYYRIVDRSGTPVTNALPLMPPPQLVTYTGGTRIRVANINSRNTFVATWDSGSGTSRAIHCASISAINGAPSIAVVVVSGSDHMLPDIGGEDTLADDEAVLVWLHASLGLIRAKQVNIPSTTPPATPAPFSGTISIGGSGASVSAGPVISRTGGTLGRFLVSWGERSGPLNSFGNLRGIIITRNIATVNSPFVIVPTALSAPRNVALDGDGESWVVAYDQRNAAGDTDVICRRVYRYQNQNGVTVEPAVDVAATSVDEQRAAVADLGDSILIGYEQRSGAGYSTVLASLDPYDCTACEGDFALEQSALLTASDVRIATTAGDPNIAAITTWEATFGAPLSIRAHLFSPRDGTADDLGGGCALGGSAGSTCSVAGNPGYKLRLAGATPAAPTFLVIGLASAPQTCGLCTLVPDPASGATLFLGATDQSGAASYAMSIPPGPTFVGMKLYQQWLTLTTQPGCALYGLDLSNAVSATIQ